MVSADARSSSWPSRSASRPSRELQRTHRERPRRARMQVDEQSSRSQDVTHRAQRTKRALRHARRIIGRCAKSGLRARVPSFRSWPASAGASRVMPLPRRRANPRGLFGSSGRCLESAPGPARAGRGFRPSPRRSGPHGTRRSPGGPRATGPAPCSRPAAAEEQRGRPPHRRPTGGRGRRRRTAHGGRRCVRSGRPRPTSRDTRGGAPAVGRAPSAATVATSSPAAIHSAPRPGSGPAAATVVRQRSFPRRTRRAARALRARCTSPRSRPRS